MTIQRICVKFTEDDLEEYLFGRLSDECRFSLESHVIQCRACRGRLDKVRHEVQTLKEAMQLFEALRKIEKRRYSRVRARGSVELRLPNGRDGSPTIRGQLVDKSKGGLGLICKRRCSVGVKIVVVQAGMHHCGVVRYCEPHNSGYHIGIEFLVA